MLTSMTHNQHVKQSACHPACPPACRITSMSYNQHQHSYQHDAQSACYAVTMSPACPPICRIASISYKQHQHAYQQVAQLARYSASMSLSSNVVIIDEASTPITYHTPTNLTFPRRAIKLTTAKTKHFARTKTKELLQKVQRKAGRMMNP